MLLDRKCDVPPTGKNFAAAASSKSLMAGAYPVMDASKDEALTSILLIPYGAILIVLASISILPSHIECYTPLNIVFDEILVADTQRKMPFLLSKERSPILKDRNKTDHYMVLSIDIECS